MEGRSRQAVGCAARGFQRANAGEGHQLIRS
jgi:hypothetical protein